ncbi:MAG: type IV toxin-antitoxin system AbiEi family antitoxin domain-containing protein [Pseudomonadota bacterium]
MTTQNKGKLNQLLQSLPEGLVVDAAWLAENGYSTSLVSKYLNAGWLERVANRVYRRPRGELTWQQVLISLQAKELLDLALIVGGRTALELQGFGHYLPQSTRDVYLYSEGGTPTWLNDLGIGVTFHERSAKRLFRNEPITRGLTSINWNTDKDSGQSADAIHGTWRHVASGQSEWPLTVSTPERAFFELLDEMPDRESFHQADMLMEGLATLSPRRLGKLLSDCRSVKVKRLFFFFAERHQHRWLKQLNAENYDLGSGNRVLVKGGKLDKRFHITVPADLDGVS